MHPGERWCVPGSAVPGWGYGPVCLWGPVDSGSLTPHRPQQEREQVTKRPVPQAGETALTGLLCGHRRLGLL